MENADDLARAKNMNEKERAKILSDIRKYTYPAEKALRQEQMFYKKPKQVITSEEYWKIYFSQHPAKKPNKIIYYEGSDPTAALNEWQEKNGIKRFSKNNESFHLGFEERRMEEKGKIPESVNKYRNRFRSLAGKVVEDYYENKSVAV